MCFLFPPSLPRVSPVSSPETKSNETAGVPPHLVRGRRPGRASPHALRGRRDQSESDVSLPIRGPRCAAHTPSTSRSDWLRAPPVGPRGQGGPEGKEVGRQWPPLSKPRSRPGPSRALGLLLSLLRSSLFRARRALRSAGVPRALTGGRGRQSAGGRVPASGLRRRIGGARGPGWEAGLQRGRGIGGAAPSQQLVISERAAQSPSSHSEEEGTKGPGPPARAGRDPEPWSRLEKGGYFLSVDCCL